jgi:hypothetical protein
MMCDSDLSEIEQNPKSRCFRATFPLHSKVSEERVVRKINSPRKGALIEYFILPLWAGDHFIFPAELDWEPFHSCGLYQNVNSGESR